MKENKFNKLKISIGSVSLIYESSNQNLKSLRKNAFADIKLLITLAETLNDDLEEIDDTEKPLIKRKKATDIDFLKGYNWIFETYNLYFTIKFFVEKNHSKKHRGGVSGG